MKQIILIVVLVLIGIGGYYGYNSQFKDNTPTGEILRVGTDATYPPLESLDKQGVIVGFDIDLINDVASQMNRKLVLKNIAFDEIFNELEKGNIDMIVSSVTITPERMAKYAFSTPYFNAGQVIVVRNDSAIAGSQGLKGKMIGAQVETTSLTEATKLTDAKLVKSYANYDVAVKDLVAQKIEAIVIDLPAGVGLTLDNPSLKVAGEPFTQEFYGMVVLKSNDKLLKQVNESLANLKKSGKLVDIRKRWKL